MGKDVEQFGAGSGTERIKAPAYTTLKPKVSGYAAAPSHRRANRHVEEMLEIIDVLKGGNVNRTSAWWFLIAFTVIGVLTIVEGINDGFTFINWVVIAVSVVFALQAVWTIARERSSQP